jgi:site-specific recombinase XerD
MITTFYKTDTLQRLDITICLALAKFWLYLRIIVMSKAHLTEHHFLLPGDLGHYLVIFTETLADQGFTPLTIRGYSDSVSHFGFWLQKVGLAIKDINVEVVSDFAKHQCDCPGGRQKHILSGKYIKRVKKFVGYLGYNNIIRVDPKRCEMLEPPQISLFGEHLYQIGLRSSTVIGYKRYMTLLLPVLGNDPIHYDASLIRKVICEAAQQRSCSESKKLASVLRIYLRFLAINGLCSPNLDTAVPAIAQWKLSSMPHYIASNDIERVIDSFDIFTHQGRRDRAIILLLARLGLRAGDIIDLRIGDINWSEGTISVTGKGRREDRLPLPQEVGDALFVYLEKTRQHFPSDHLFLCLNAPYRAFSKSSSVADIVRAALLRAGIENPPSYGAHLLRHSAATSLLRSGATLETVATVLRHRSLDMTAYYAKVDIPSLMKIAQPWPEIASC